MLITGKEFARQLVGFWSIFERVSSSLLHKRSLIYISGSSPTIRQEGPVARMVLSLLARLACQGTHLVCEELAPKYEDTETRQVRAWASSRQLF